MSHYRQVQQANAPTHCRSCDGKLLLALDKAADFSYRSQPFPNKTKRIEFLFTLYDKYASGMFANQKIKKANKVL